MSLPRILLQLDSDPHASSFDAVVATDAGVHQLLQYGGVNTENVVGLVHGAMFTRGPQQLQHSAIFVGGSNVQAGEAIAKKVAETFFGPMRVSVLVDGNGSNTTSAAAVLCAGRHFVLNSAQALVLGGTGPVGSRVARLLLGQGAEVRLASRDSSRAEQAKLAILEQVAQGESNGSPQDRIQAMGASDEELRAALSEVDLVFGCGAAGIALLSEEQLAESSVRVAIDLNAVPPAGLTGIAATDKAVERDGRVDYGAIGVGGLKMKIHKECIRRLFTANDQFLDAEEVFDVGLGMERERNA